MCTGTNILWWDIKKSVKMANQMSHATSDTYIHFVLLLQVTEEQHLRNLSSGMNSLQQTLEEAGRLLKLVWRVSLPAGGATAGESSTNQQVD